MEGTIPDRNPKPSGILEGPQDKPVISDLLSKAWVSREHLDSLRVLPVYKVVTLFLVK